MEKLLFLVALIFTGAHSLNVFRKQFEQLGRIQRENDGAVDPGDALILTPLLQQKKIEEARNASEVHHTDFRGIKSYSGYFTVNEDFNSNLFFWFFPAEQDFENAPVVLWLQGGPGGSSLFGLFLENGPFEFVDEDTLALRNYSWAKTQNVIFIDNPAGTGFSFTSSGGYCRDQTQVGEELYSALVQFFTLFPELQKNSFYITGESYAGKYVPAAAHTIHIKNPAADLKINLKGVGIGDGYSDPVHQNNYSDFLYQVGLIDINQKKEMKIHEDMMVAYIHAEEWVQAADLFDKLMGYYTQFSGATNYYNYLTEQDPTNDASGYMDKYLNRNDIRRALHVGTLPYNSGAAVYEALHKDMPKSVAPWVSEILSYYDVLIFNGEVDVIVAYPVTVNYLQNLNFSAADAYKTAKRFQWHVNGKLAGYVKEAGNLTEVMVRKAGHMVPYDQPEWAYDLIYRFTRQLPLH